MTKAITSVAALQLVEKGLIGLDDPLNELMPEMVSIPILGEDGKLFNSAQAISLRQLLTNTSGFGLSLFSSRLYNFKPESWTYEDQPRLFQPGTSFAYGTGLDWVGKVVEKLSGQDLETYFRENITGPLQMNETWFNVPEELSEKIVTFGGRDSSGIINAWIRIPEEPVTTYEGADGLPVPRGQGAAGAVRSSHGHRLTGYEHCWTLSTAALSVPEGLMGLLRSKSGVAVASIGAEGRSSMSACRWRIGALLVAAAACFVAMAGPAGAHGPEATFTPISQEPVAGELAVQLRVTLIYNDDADPVDDASVQVTPVDGSGAEGAQATLARTPEPGTYEGTVPVPTPGEWTFKLSSSDPESELDLAVTIAEPAPATTATPTTEAAPTSVMEKDPPVASSLPEGSPATDAETAIVSDDVAPDAEADEGSFPWGIAVLVAVVAAGVAMAMAYALRGEKDEAVGGDPEDPTGDIPADGGSSGPVV